MARTLRRPDTATRFAELEAEGVRLEGLAQEAAVRLDQLAARARTFDDRMRQAHALTARGVETTAPEKLEAEQADTLTALARARLEADGLRQASAHAQHLIGVFRVEHLDHFIAEAEQLSHAADEANRTLEAAWLDAAAAYSAAFGAWSQVRGSAREAGRHVGPMSPNPYLENQRVIGQLLQTAVSPAHLDPVRDEAA